MSGLFLFIGQFISRIHYLELVCEVFSLESGNTTTATKDDKNITYIERNGKTFVIVEHFTGTNTYLDIVKNALRREAELDSKAI